MGKPKQKVNAKQFLEDFRSGKDDLDLMRTHRLNPETLWKLLNLLVKKGLLDPSELERAAAETDSALTRGPAGRATGTQARDECPPLSLTCCPQCNAAVTAKMLICPECGHVLPGAERWERVEPKKKFIDRVPPWVLGMLFALPMLAAVLLVYRDIIFPITTATIDKKSEEFRKQTTSRKKPPSSAQSAVEARAPGSPVDTLIDQLTGDDVLSSVNEDYSVFRIGNRWFQMPHDHKILCLDRLRRAMKLSSVKKIDFEVVDFQGELIAWVTEDMMQFPSLENETGSGLEH